MLPDSTRVRPIDPGVRPMDPKGVYDDAPLDPWRKKPEGEERREDGGQDP